MNQPSITACSTPDFSVSTDPPMIINQSALSSLPTEMTASSTLLPPRARNLIITFKPKDKVTSSGSAGISGAVPQTIPTTKKSKKQSKIKVKADIQPSKVVLPINKTKKVQQTNTQPLVIQKENNSSKRGADVRVKLPNWDCSACSFSNFGNRSMP